MTTHSFKKIKTQRSIAQWFSFDGITIIKSIILTNKESAETKRTIDSIRFHFLDFLSLGTFNKLLISLNELFDFLAQCLHVKISANW